MRPGLVASHLVTMQMSDLLPHSLRPKVLRGAGARIGEPAFLKAGLRVSRPWNLTLGDRVFINFDCFIDAAGGVTIGDGVDIGDHVRLISASHEIGPADRRGGTVFTAPVVIEDGVWIGSGITVLPGVTVGTGCVIGAGAVVTRDCEPNGLYVGVPARRVRDLDQAEAVTPE